VRSPRISSCCIQPASRSSLDPTLIEKVEACGCRRGAEAGVETAAELARDLRDQLASMKKMGPLEGLLDLLPKAGAFKALRQPESVDEKALTRVTAIIDSMTTEERRYPQVLNGSRKKRIAGGSGTSVAEINRLLKQYQQMRRLMRTAKKGSGVGLVETGAVEVSKQEKAGGSKR
jgi:signal recognition particle subunit SRP54